MAIGGGQDAKDVTTTKVDPSQFATRVHHKVYGEEIGKIKGHFGPIHTISFSPDGKQVVSGAEDGFIRMNRFDPDYFEKYSIEKDIDELRLPETIQSKIDANWVFLFKHQIFLIH